MGRFLLFCIISGLGCSLVAAEHRRYQESRVAALVRTYFPEHIYEYVTFISHLGISKNHSSLFWMSYTSPKTVSIAMIVVECMLRSKL